MKTENEKFNEPRLRVGETATIFNNAISGDEVVEGQAILREYSGEAYEDFSGRRIERWEVEFVDQRGERFARNVRVSKYRAKQR